MQGHGRLINLSLVAIGSIPTAIALFLCGRMLYIIWPELDAARRYAALDGLVLFAAPGGAAALAGIWCLWKRISLPRLFLLGLLAFALLCFFVFFQYRNAQPVMRSWMFDPDTYLTILIAAQLPLFYFLTYLVASAFTIESRGSLIFTGIATIASPVVLYLALQMLRFLPQGDIYPHMAQLLFLAMNAVFSFLLMRLLVFLLRRHAEKLRHDRTQTVLQVLFVGVFPFVGLLLNAYGPLAHESQLVLGNFTAPEIWLITLVNAVLYALPAVSDRRISLVLLALRTAGFIFVLYFCVVFLLFLPLALVLIIAFGFGLLLLIPYLAALMQLVRLTRDIGHLWQTEKRLAVAALAIGAVFLPAVIAAHIALDRARLVETIAYVQRPPLKLNQSAPVSASLAMSFASPADRGGRGIRHSKSNLPIYDGIYRSFVFDGVELSEGLRRRIRRTFSAEKEVAPRPRPGNPQTAFVAKVTSHSALKGNLTATEVRVRVENNTTTAGELSTEITLPDGVFVSGHWLTIDGNEVPAQITTRNTAIWAYDRVTERQRDPSLLYYQSPHVLRWKVFPVPGGGFREARIEFLHAFDSEILIGGKRVSLAARSKAAQVFVSSSGQTLLIGPASENEMLRRKPYLHFVTDCSVSAPENYTQRASEVAKRLVLPLESARVSYVNSGMKTTQFSEKRAVSCDRRTGGFFPELAIRSILHEAYLAGSTEFPLLIILSERPLAAEWEDLSFVKLYYHDADGFMHAQGNELKAISFSGAALASDRPRYPLPVRNAGGRYVSSTAALVPMANLAGEPLPALLGFEHYLTFWSGKLEGRANAVIHAIETGILNPAAGSVVLETEAQRRKLDELHKQMLKAVGELDAGEPVRMSEPWLYMLVFAVGFLLYRRWRLSRSKAATP